MPNTKIYSSIYKYKYNYKKCLMLEYIILYRNTINKYLLIIIMIIKIYIETKNTREKKSYYAKLSRALYGLLLSIYISRNLKF